MDAQLHPVEDRGCNCLSKTCSQLIYVNNREIADSLPSIICKHDVEIGWSMSYVFLRTVICVSWPSSCLFRVFTQVYVYSLQSFSEHIRKHHGNVEVNILYEDQPVNDFKSLFLMIHGGYHFITGSWLPIRRRHFRCIFVNETCVFWLKFHWSLFLSVQLTRTQHWFR